MSIVLPPGRRMTERNGDRNVESVGDRQRHRLASELHTTWCISYCEWGTHLAEGKTDEIRKAHDQGPIGTRGIVAPQAARQPPPGDKRRELATRQVQRSSKPGAARRSRLRVQGHAGVRHLADISRPRSGQSWWSLTGGSPHGRVVLTERAIELDISTERGNLTGSRSAALMLRRVAGV